MLDDVVFTMEFDRVSKRFRRKTDADLATGYFEFLQDKLDNDRFRAACAVIFQEWDKFPKPVDFLLVAPPPSKLLGSEERSDPYAEVVIYLRRGSGQHKAWERTMHDRRRAREQGKGEEVFVDTRGVTCSARSRNYQNDAGHGFPIPRVEVVE